jgi:hypothetical protein
MANVLRGEIDWTVGENLHTLRLSLEDLKSLQQNLNIPTLKWQEKIQDRDLGMVEIDAILTLALRRGDATHFRRPSDVAAVLEEAGFFSSLQAAINVLVESLRDPVDRKKEQEEKDATPLQ